MQKAIFGMEAVELTRWYLQVEESSRIGIQAQGTANKRVPNRVVDALRLEFPVRCLTIRATVQVSQADWSKLVSVGATRLNFHELCDRFRPHVARLCEPGVRLFHRQDLMEYGTFKRV